MGEKIMKYPTVEIMNKLKLIFNQKLKLKRHIY